MCYLYFVGVSIFFWNKTVPIVMAFCDTVRLLFYNFKTPFFVQFIGVSQPHSVFIFFGQFAYLAPFNDILCAWALIFVRFCDSVLDRLFLLFSDVFALKFTSVNENEIKCLKLHVHFACMSFTIHSYPLVRTVFDMLTTVSKTWLLELERVWMYILWMWHCDNLALVMILCMSALAPV